MCSQSDFHAYPIIPNPHKLYTVRASWCVRAGERWAKRPLELVLEDEQVVGGGHGDDAFVRVPRRVENLLVEVQAVYAYLVLAKETIILNEL